MPLVGKLRTFLLHILINPHILPDKWNTSVPLHFAGGVRPAGRSKINRGWQM